MYRALIVCNSRFPADPGALRELQGPKADGVLLRDALTDPSAGLFQRTEVRLLLEADSSEIITVAEDFFSGAEPDDTLLFYYSGHGRSLNQQLFLCASNTKVDRLRSTAFIGSVLSEMIAASFAQVKIVILDCCHSGVFKGDDEIVERLSGHGRFVIAATSATDRAADAEVRGEPSPFTKALTDGLLADAGDRDSDQVVDLDDLFAYLKQVKFDGHEAHRKFDGAGAVPIARRPTPPVAEPADSLPVPVPPPRGRLEHADNDVRPRPHSASLDDIARGEALSEKHIEAFRQDLRDDMAAALPRQLTSNEFLQRAGLLKDGHPTRAGVLLFGQNPTTLIPAAMVRCVRFRGTRKTDPVESVDLHGTVPELIVQARDFVARSSQLGEAPTAASAYSETTYRYPMIAVREIIANAVVHRDYGEQAACVQIHVFDDRIEVISPGTWGGASAVPDGQLRLGTLEGQSQPRNFRLARLLTWVKLVESVGAGLPRSVENCRAVGSPEPVVVIRQGLITVTIFPMTEDTRDDVPPPRTGARVEYSQHLDGERIAQVGVRSPNGTLHFGGSGYRVTNDCVLTAAHLARGSTALAVQLYLSGEEWIGPATVAWVDESADVAILRFEPPSHATVVAPVRYGRMTTRPAVVTVETAGYPSYKRNYGFDSAPINDVAHLVGTASSLANLRSGTLEVHVDAPADSPDHSSPWAGFSGAPVWAEGRIVGIVTQHNSLEGLGSLTAVRIERALAGSSEDRESLATLLNLGQPGKLVEIPRPEPEWESPYLAQIRDLAPLTLQDRQPELAELAAFCQGNEPYVLWQGGPWTGKTALLSSFALRPPPETDVVSFFITGRLAGQSDSMAFTDALIEQLALLLDEPSLSTRTLASGARDLLRRRLLADAAQRAQSEGRRLLLMVDGLDEDRGPQTGLPSIASLLPKNPDEGLRVLVTGRPTLLPADVPHGHPLRSCRVRTLAPSSAVQDTSQTALYELRAVLEGAAENRDVIGLVAASRKRLTLSDLALLTDQAPYQLETMFSGSLGRLFAVHRDEASTPTFVFANEVLRSAAMQQIGPNLMFTYAEMLTQHRPA
ncbi:caspase family protein [Streptomyces sp. NBC_01615]|uniref:caspase, EACC1-associated type n=1 Tax=Streptomyces sp. NBC_01615 TaxID=2975898 RepID=UPI003863F2AF